MIACSSACLSIYDQSNNKGCWEKEDFCQKIDRLAEKQKNGHLQLHVKGQFWPQELWMRFGNAARREVLAAVAPPRNLPWLHDDDVVVHLRVCAPGKGTPPDKPFVEAGMRLYLPPSFFDTLFGEYMANRPIRKIWVAQQERETDGSGPCEEERFHPNRTALLKHLGEKWGAQLVTAM